MHEGDLAFRVGVLDDAVTERTERSIGRPEGAKDDIGGGSDSLLGDNLVGDLINETVQLLVCYFH